MSSCRKTRTNKIIDGNMTFPFVLVVAKVGQIFTSKMIGLSDVAIVVGVVTVIVRK